MADGRMPELLGALRQAWLRHAEAWPKAVAEATASIVQSLHDETCDEFKLHQTINRTRLVRDDSP